MTDQVLNDGFFALGRGGTVAGSGKAGAGSPRRLRRLAMTGKGASLFRPTICCYKLLMTRDSVISVLQAHEAELRRLGVEHLFLFGSVARNEAQPDSDVDLFFDHPEGSLGLFALMDVKDTAAKILGRKVDIMTRRSLHHVLRPGIEASAVPVF